MADLDRVRPGDPFPTKAGTVNAWNEAAEAYRRARGGIGVPDSSEARQTGYALVENTSGADRNRFDVLGIGEPLRTPVSNLAEFRNQIVFKGVKPTADHYGRFVVLWEALAEDRIGVACYSGITVAKVDFTDFTFGYADVRPDEAGALQTSPIGTARILWPLTGEGIQDAVVLLGATSERELIGIELAEDHPARGVVFEVYVAPWNSEENNYSPYDRSVPRKAIDWRYGVPYPDKCATGTAFWQPSDDHGWILYVNDLDCETPGCAGSS